MSPVQRAEDPARNLHSVWLGPTNAWRWPFDATYTEWGIGFAMFPLAFVSLWLVLPLGALMALGSLASGRGLAHRVDKNLLARWTRTTPENARRRGSRALSALVLLLAIALVPNPATWALPMSWWAAVPGALYVAARLVKMARPWIDGNRPVTYWLHTLRGVATGPRARREPLAVGFGDEPQINDVVLDDAMADFLALLQQIDPKEVRVPLFRRKMPVVEAATFDSSTGQESTCGAVVAWLRDRGIQVDVVSLDRREVLYDDGSTALVPCNVVIRVAGVEVGDGTVITLTREKTPRVEFVTVRDFNRDYERVEAR